MGPSLCRDVEILSGASHQQSRTETECKLEANDGVEDTSREGEWWRLRTSLRMGIRQIGVFPRFGGKMLRVLVCSNENVLKEDSFLLFCTIGL